jgi:phosphoethanolamine N-methyltransferase
MAKNRMHREMTEESEYYDGMIKLLEWLWGEGYLAPGGEGNVDRLMQGLDLSGKHILDIGCGLGGPAFYLAEKYQARVTGIDLEEHLILEAAARTRQKGLEGRTEFLTVEPGPLAFADASFDLVYTSGALTQTEDTPGIMAEIFRVLKPGGYLTCYEWHKSEGELSADMLYFFKMEGLTYHMVTLQEMGGLMEMTGFEDVAQEDVSDWYRIESRREYELISGPGYEQVVELIGKQDADHLVEDWRSMVVVCEKGEMRQGYSRGRKPA